MDSKDREKIDYLCKYYLLEIDMEKLWPKLLEHRIYNRDDVNIPKWQQTLSTVDTIFDICDTIKTRGPRAYRSLILSLRESGHEHIANKLDNCDFSYKVACSTTLSQKVEKLNISDNSSNASNQNDDHTKDDYHKTFQKDDKKLEIKVKKAEQFLDDIALDKNALIHKYPMRSNPRGLVLIIANITYSCLNNRPSAKYDVENLETLFTEMGFRCIIYTDVKGNEIKQKVKEFSQMKELRRVDSAFIIISSHGSGKEGQQKTEIQGTDYHTPSYESVFCTDITDYFNSTNCENLKGKPKIFIFQTCRGHKHQKSVPNNVTDSVKSDLIKRDISFELTQREYTDTFIAYSTLPGYYSYRDTYNGSWFIQILCEVFMNHAWEKHILDLFVMTDSRLEICRTANDYCQTLWTLNQGFKHCYLNPGLFK